jgi:hypothetical protein
MQLPISLPEDNERSGVPSVGLGFRATDGEVPVMHRCRIIEEQSISSNKHFDK